MLLLALAACAATVPASHAQTTSLATGDVRCAAAGGGFDRESKHVGPSPTSEQVKCVTRGTGLNASSEANASLERREGQRETVSTEVDAASTVSFLVAAGSAIAGLTYDLLIASRRAPPRRVDVVPVTVQGSARSLALVIGDPSEGLAGAEAFARLFITQGNERLWALDSITRANTHGPNDSTGSWSDLEQDIEVRIGPAAAPVLVTVNASCRASARNLAASCSAFADPDFAFDQVAFDALSAAQGLPSFHLDEFFAFEFPPNMQALPGPGPEPGPGPGPEPGPAPVPAPPAWLLVGLGLAAVASAAPGAPREIAIVIVEIAAVSLVAVERRPSTDYTCTRAPLTPTLSLLPSRPGGAGGRERELFRSLAPGRGRGQGEGAVGRRTRVDEEIRLAAPPRTQARVGVTARDVVTEIDCAPFLDAPIETAHRAARKPARRSFSEWSERDPVPF